MESFFSRSDVGIADFLKVLKTLELNDKEDLVLIAGLLGLDWIDRKIMPDLNSSSTVNTKKENNRLEAKRKENNTNNKQTEYIDQGNSNKQTEYIDQGNSNKQTEYNNQENNNEPIAYIDQADYQIAKVLQPIKEENIESSNTDSEPVNIFESVNTKPYLSSIKYQGLLRKEWFQGLMVSILSTSTNSQELDWIYLEKCLANGLPFTTLPFKKRLTIKRGVCLFIDRSESMQPFWRDEDELIVQLEHLLGANKVKTFWLEMDRWSFSNVHLEWISPYPIHLPVNTPIVIVSDFGSKGNPSNEDIMEVEAWSPVFHLAKKNNCPLIALIPSPEVFWPNIIKKRIPLAFSWDRGTSIQTVISKR